MLGAKATAVIAVGAGIVLSACTAPLGRPAGAGSSAPLAACTRAGGDTPNGGTSCVDGRQFRCSNGAWQPTALRCEP